MISQWVTTLLVMPHCGITIGNDVAIDIHYDVTMGNDIPMYTYHSITILSTLNSIPTSGQ